MAQSLWSWEAVQFERIETESGIKTNAADETWNVSIARPHQAWGYRIALPEDAKMYIMWRATLTVSKVEGDILPGIACFSDGEGIAFQVDLAHTRAELRHALPSMKTVRVGLFRLPELVELPFTMQIEFNAVTKKCCCFVNSRRLVDVKLPFKSLPLFDVLSDIEIISTTPQRGEGGSIEYGQLSLQCE